MPIVDIISSVLTSGNVRSRYLQLLRDHKLDSNYLKFSFAKSKLKLLIGHLGILTGKNVISDL